ncbi:mitochondrial chaperone BCS1 [Guyanagaster necrorhizus]|uniref:Mitochondrial chaperone BCS1 n=1 Tax=Guyanagaster necrorhizus TaxID=856835 RepID=A0A9P7VW03_9AGAR|nr:mitochondrial chaperone BCS1 [Guyanagaster necrorhizus MCA 3950]KAG7447969.1 mitochondrial chaperone BCS1 [Guyanagaster necrorhizus MCA 3950]
MSSDGALVGSVTPTVVTTDVTPTSPNNDGGILSQLFKATGIGSDNPYFNAGFGLMGVGVVVAYASQALKLGSIALQRRLLVTLEIRNKDPSYDWFLTWLALQTTSSPRPDGRVRWARSSQLSVETRMNQEENTRNATFDLVAGPGNHYFKYRGAWIKMTRQRETRAVNLRSGDPWETVSLTTLSRDRNIFPVLLSEARDIAARQQEGKLVIYTAWGVEWRPFGKARSRRPLPSVVLAPGQSERIQQDLKSFMERRQWYADRGIPYRRGYLLHGPPGSGKSSFIQALAGAFSYDISIISLSERGLGDDKFNFLLSNAPARTFVLIEDIDAAFNRRVQTSEDGYQSSVTFSGFLNALDGVASGEERIIFMTTNHVERLDPALIRPGRVDVSELLDHAVPDQAYSLFISFYGGDSLVSKETLEAIGTNLKNLVSEEMDVGRRISMAELQGLFIRTDVQQVMKACEDIFTQKHRQ